jgi:endo-1,4-beta-mannosidase
MWLQYRPDIVRQELQVLAEHGCTVTRSFCYWPDFVPEPERLDEQALAHFTDFLDAHADLDLETIPTFIVGHMSGENWDPPWRQGRDLYRDVWLVSQQAWFVEEIVGRFHEHAVAGWLLSNEMPLYGGPASTEEVTAWARILVQAARAAGATQPISIGDGVWGVEVSGTDNGYSLRSLAPLVDFIGPHSYPMEDDQVRQSLTPAFACELAGSFGKPVVLEEFGVSSDFAADDQAAAYYRQVLHTSLLAGARGWLAWNNCDFDDLRHQDPYRHHTFELHFGLTDGRGEPKPQLRTLRDFASLVSELGEWDRVTGEAALVVPEHFERVLPFTEPAYRSDIRTNLLQAYIAAREADLPIELVRERDGLPGADRLYLVPCAKLMTAPGIDRLRELAESGATIYLSYFTGSTPTQRGPWLSWLDEIFGIRHRLRYGLVDPIVEDEVTLKFVDDLGDIAEGSSLTFRVAGEPSARAYLPLDPLGAEVVAVDGHGRPALLRNRLGAGSAVLCTYPLEHMAARSPGVNPEDTWRIYSALAIEAGVERAVRVDDPRVLVGLIRSGESETALFLNCAAEPMTVDPIISALELNLPTASLALEPFGVAAVRCIRTEVESATVVAADEGRDARP